jgi:hypothetical protein
MFHELFVTDIFLGNRGIYKPALFDLMARASKDPQGNVQNDTNTLRPIAGSPWRAGSHSVSRKSGRWIYQRIFSFTPMPFAPHAVNSRFRYALLFANHRDTE